MKNNRLLIVGDASSIFIYNYVKALKEQTDYHVTVYSPIKDRHTYIEYPYDEVVYDKYFNSFVSRLPFFGTRLLSYFVRRNFSIFLRQFNKYYDIIHFHWILPCWVINSSEYKKYARYVGATLWGGEVETLKLFNSQKLYRKQLGFFFNNIDFNISSGPKPELNKKYPILEKISYYGIYGSSIIEEISRNKQSTEEAYSIYGIDKEKITVLIGYSGKTIHHHCEILKKIQEYPLFKEYQHKIHFLASMSRGATDSYVKKVENAMISTGCTYTMITGYQSDKEVASFRIATKVAFQLSDFDGLSNSIKEILTAGSYLICGDWFGDYYILKKNGFRYQEVSSFDQGIKEFYNYLAAPTSKEQWINQNMSVGRNQFSWTECIKSWIKVYKHFME